MILYGKQVTIKNIFWFSDICIDSQNIPTSWEAAAAEA